MANQIPGKCPICEKDLIITALKCKSCNTEIKGEFAMGNFFNLSSEQLDFVKIFIKSRGNIKEVEKELGISYPTVRSKLDRLIENLGYDINESPDDNAAERRKEILDLLENGEISAEKAARMIKKI